MKKILTIILVFIGTITFGQSVQIETFQLNKIDSINKSPMDKMNYPIIHSSNKKVDSLINTDLKNRLTYNEFPNESIDSTLIKWASDQIVFFDYEVTYNEKGILSINMSVEGCGAYCTNWKEYFNYSTIKGNWLTIADVVDTTGEFREKVYKDEKIQFSEQKKELKEMLNDPESGIGKNEYDWALEYYENCEKSFNLETFQIYPDKIKIIEDCYLPNAIKNMTPVIDLTYKLDQIKEYLKIKN